MLDATELGLELPRRASQLLDQMEQGNLKFNVSHEGLREFTQQLHRMVNRLILAILLAAMTITLGLTAIAYHQTGWERYGGLFLMLAFLVSLGFGLLLVFNLWRSGR
jgi:hypothetical protein